MWNSVLLALCLTACATVTTAPPIAVTESAGVAGQDPLARFALTLHVILQVHENPNAEARARQDMESVAACQAKIVEWVGNIARSGARSVIVEGLYLVGSFDKPEPITVGEIDEGERGKAKWRLAQRSDLSVYGFELKPLNDFGAGIVSQFGKSIAQAQALSERLGPAMSAQDHQLQDQHIQDEFTRLNLWYAGVIPERSFLALQTALAVALARGENAVQLVIGKQHWGDLVYAANRHPDVRLRLVPYACD